MNRLLFTILALTAMAYTAAAMDGLGLRVTKPRARRPSSGNVVSSNVLKLEKGGKGTTRSSSHLRNLRANLAPDRKRHDYGAVPVENILSAEYITEIAWSGNPVKVIIDTGSSDSWLVQDGFTCVDKHKKIQPQANCMFGPPFKGTFDGGAISDQHFNLTYADLEFITGVMGYETVTVAGITVQRQEVALVDYAYWFGDSVTSGLMGLAYPQLTSAFSGTRPPANGADTQIPYDPIMTTMIKQGLIEPIFSLVLERDSNDGYLALGGLPPVNHTGIFASTPILMIDVFDEVRMETEYSFYTIIADAYIYTGSQNTRANTGAWGQLLQNVTVNTTQFPVIVDSGTTLMYLPTVFSKASSGPVTACNASVPEFGISIGGQVFMVSQDDMLLQSSSDPDTGLCDVGIRDGKMGPYILGDTFMNNVISVFDIGAAEMRFAAKEH